MLDSRAPAKIPATPPQPGPVGIANGTRCQFLKRGVKMLSFIGVARNGRKTWT